MKKIFYLFLYFFLVSFAIEDGFVLLKKAQEDFYKQTIISVDFQIIIEYVADEKQTINGTFYKSNKGFYLQQGDVKMIKSAGYLVNISESDKVVSVEQNQEPLDFLNKIQSVEIPREYYTYKISKVNNGQKNIDFFVKPEMEFKFYDKVSFTLNQEGKIIKSIYYLNKENQGDASKICKSITIIFNEKKDPENKENLLDFNNYFTLSNGKIRLNKPYQNYQLISSLNMN